jgi:hypothetical protein
METVCLICTQARDKSKKGVSFQSLLTIIRREFRIAGLDVKIKSERKKYLGVEEFYVNAYYDAEEDLDRATPIEVVILHNFDADATWERRQITDLLVQVFDAVVHEYKHQRQSRKRKHVTYIPHVRQPYDEYLQDPDEIDAYALSIAIELCRTLGKHRALRHMSRLTTLARFKVNERYVSPNLNAYVAHFEKPISPLLRRLAKKVYVRLMKVDTDHIFM